MPAQNPGDPGGLSAYGRWMYGPWFWPPAAATEHGPIANPYYDPDCDLNDPDTWTYQTDPFCEPQQIPGTPNISAGMEQFNDTPTVNGIAYPEVTLQPKSYRFRVLNAANDRFFNFQWYVADPTTGTDSEVALDPLLLEQAQTDPVVFPTPVHNAATNGPDWVQIGTEGGFLPAPVVVDGQQETTWITDPTRFDVGNVDKHSLLLAPAERADVIVDFSQVRRQDPDPVQRRTGRVPGPRAQLRLLHRAAGPEPQRPLRGAARLRPQHAHHHARQDRRGRSGRGVQPHQAAQRVQPQDRRLGRL